MTETWRQSSALIPKGVLERDDMKSSRFVCLDFLNSSSGVL